MKNSDYVNAVDDSGNLLYSSDDIKNLQKEHPTALHAMLDDDTIGQIYKIAELEDLIDTSKGITAGQTSAMLDQVMSIGGTSAGGFIGHSMGGVAGAMAGAVAGAALGYALKTFGKAGIEGFLNSDTGRRWMLEGWTPTAGVTNMLPDKAKAMLAAGVENGVLIDLAKLYQYANRVAERTSTERENAKNARMKN